LWVYVSKKETTKNKAVTIKPIKISLKRKMASFSEGKIAETSNSKLQKVKVYIRSSDIGKGEC
jgi:hypothetical protein